MAGKLLNFHTGQTIFQFSDSRCCGQDAQFQSAKEVEAFIKDKHRHGAMIILTGDLNVQDGYEKSRAVRYFKGQSQSAHNPPYVLEDTFRTANGEHVDGTTFEHAGKIDYIFARKGTRVESSVIDRKNYGPASDHWPINAVIKVQGF